jgi:apolipoprotein N-acyltransferase
MFGLLRFIRGFCGFCFALQIFGLFPVLTWLQNPGAVTSGMWAHVFIKIIFLALFGGLFFGLRKLLNKLYFKKYGGLHPILGDRKWAL